MRRIKVAEAIASTLVTSEFNLYQVPKLFSEFAPLLRIRSGVSVVPFVPFPYQLELSDIIDRHRGTILFKTRQIGCSELVAAKFLHQAILNPAFAGVVLSMGQTESSNISTRIQGMPSQVQSFEWQLRSQTHLRVKNGGKIFFRPATPNAARSLESISSLFFDESAFPRNIEEIYSSASPTQEMVGENARTIIASTMSEDGKLTWFWRMLNADNGDVDAETVIEEIRRGNDDIPGTESPTPGMVWWKDSNGWAKVIVSWRAHPGYAQIPDYLEYTKRNNKLTEDKLQREHNLGIPAAGGSLFPSSAIATCSTGKWNPNREAAHHYIIGIDPNFGGTDFFVAQVWDITKVPFSLVAEYRESGQSNTKARKKCIELIDTYKPVIVAVEANSGGTVIAENLSTDRPRSRVELVKTTKFSKLTMTDRIAVCLEQGEVVFPPDWEGIREMRQFSALHREAITGHDDEVMAWAIAFAYLEEALKGRRDFSAWRLNHH